MAGTDLDRPGIGQRCRDLIWPPNQEDEADTVSSFLRCLNLPTTREEQRRKARLPPSLFTKTTASRVLFARPPFQPSEHSALTNRKLEV